MSERDQDHVLHRIRVASYPLVGHRSLEAAIAAPGTHPLRPIAEQCSAELAGRRLIGAVGELERIDLSFSGALRLVIGIAERFPSFAVERGETRTDFAAKADGVLLEWSPKLTATMDWGTRLSSRRDRVLTRVFVNEFGLLLYFERTLILGVSAVRRVDGSGDILVPGDFE